MKAWVGTADDKGVALPLALFALVMLSGLLAAFVSLTAMEPQISRNLGDTTQARYAAEAGVEWGFDQLALAPAVGAGSWNAYLQAGGVMTPAGGQTFPGLAAAFGTYTVQIRNDVLPTDTALTGLPPEPAANAANDTNGAIIVTATGTYNGVSRSIQVVMRRVSLPPLPGAYNLPGFQADLWVPGDKFNIDGRDYLYGCTANCADPDLSKRTYDYVANSDQSKMKFGIAVQPGNQQNTSPQVSYELEAESALNTPKKQANVMGKSQAGGGFTSGLDSVAAPSDPNEVLNPAKMQNFLTQLAQFSGTKVIQSTLACSVKQGVIPMGLVMTGNDADPSKPTLTNGCGLSQTLDLGSRDNPKLVYVKGEPDPNSLFAGLVLDGPPIKGAGILVVEDGDLYFQNQLDWDGLIIVTGKYVSSSFEKGSEVNIYGATVSNETVWNEGGNKNQQLFAEGWFDGKAVQLRNSIQMLNMVQRKLLFRISTWREI